MKAGFGSPSDDSVEEYLDIGEYLISNPNSTFLVRVAGESMSGDNITTGDILVVDKSLTFDRKSIIIAHLNGEFMMKRFVKNRLISSNPTFDDILITESDEFIIWGVVIGVFRKL